MISTDNNSESCHVLDHGPCILLLVSHAISTESAKWTGLLLLFSPWRSLNRSLAIPLETWCVREAWCVRGSLVCAGKPLWQKAHDHPPCLQGDWSSLHYIGQCFLGSTHSWLVRIRDSVMGVMEPSKNWRRRGLSFNVSELWESLGLYFGTEVGKYPSAIPYAFRATWVSSSAKVAKPIKPRRCGAARNK